MGWLNATNHVDELEALNNSSPFIKILLVDGVDGGKLVSDRALSDLDGYLSHFASWYRLLSPTTEFPKPKEKPKSRPRR